MQALSIVQDKKIEEYFSMILEIGYDCDIKSISTSFKASDLIEKTDTKFIFFEYLEDNLDENNGVLNLIKKSKRQLSLILISDKPLEDIDTFKNLISNDQGHGHISKDFQDQELFDVFENCISYQKDTVKVKRTEVGNRKFSNMQYNKIKIFSKKSPVNFYIKIGPNKMIKVINEGDAFETKDILKYQQGLNDKIFIIEEEQTKVFEYYRKVFNQIKKIKIKDPAKNSVRSVVILDFALEKARKLGFTNEDIEMVTHINDECIKEMKLNKGLSEIIEKLQSNENFVTNHSLLISMVALRACKQLGWHDEKTLKKISFAALMHDYVFNDMDLARVQTRSELEELILDSPNASAKRKKVISHPIDVAEVLKSLKTNMMGVDTIILEHHERPDGSGFPKGLTAAQISPLGCLFIIAEDLVLRILDKEITKKRVEIIKKDLKREYNKGNFRNVLKGFDFLNWSRN